MFTYEILKPVTLPSGLVGLNELQAGKRLSNLEPLGEGVYRILRPIQFKAGEVLSFDGRISEISAKIYGEEAEAFSETPEEQPQDPTEGPADGETEATVTVKEIADQLGLTVKDACELLADYDLQVSVWNAKVPKETADLVLAEHKNAQPVEVEA